MVSSSVLDNIFWKHWVEEYLPLLHGRQKWSDIKKNLQPGDIVLVVDDRLPRNSGPLGTVVEIKPYRNGLVRRFEIRTKSAMFLDLLINCV